MSRFNHNKKLSFLTSTLLGFSMLSASCAGPTPANEIAPDQNVQMEPSSPSQMDALQAIKQAALDITPVRDPVQAQELISQASELGYEPESGLTQAFDRAQVSATSDGSMIISVPLTGTNTPEVTKVSYIQNEGTWNIMELSVHQDSKDQASLKMWMDGNLVRDQLIHRASDDLPYGMNWGRLKSCLVNDANLNWVVLSSLATICSVACLVSAGTACVLCVAGVAGFNTGTIGECVRRSWR